MMTLGLKLDNFDINEMTPSLCSLETLNTAASSLIHQVHQLKLKIFVVGVQKYFNIH